MKSCTLNEAPRLKCLLDHKAHSRPQVEQVKMTSLSLKLPERSSLLCTTPGSNRLLVPCPILKESQFKSKLECYCHIWAGATQSSFYSFLMSPVSGDLSCFLDYEYMDIELDIILKIPIITKLTLNSIWFLLFLRLNEAIEELRNLRKYVTWG